MRLMLLILFSVFASRAEIQPLFIEGYAGKVSYVAPEELTFHVSTTAPRYNLQIVRIGATNTVVLSTNGIAGGEHPIPENASSHGPL